jgi:hypothetical protein
MPRAIATLEEHDAGVYSIERFIFADGAKINESPWERWIESMAAAREMYRMFENLQKKNMPRLKEVVFDIKYSFMTFEDMFPSPHSAVQLYFQRIHYPSTIRESPEVFVETLRRLRCDSVTLSMDCVSVLPVIQSLFLENRIQKIRVYIRGEFDWPDDVLQAMAQNTSIKLFNFKLWASSASTSHPFDLLKMIRHLPRRVEMISMSHQTSPDAVFQLFDPVLLFSELAAYERLWYLRISNLPFVDALQNSQRHAVKIKHLAVQEIEFHDWSPSLTPHFLEFVIAACPKLYTIVLKGPYDYITLADTIVTTSCMRDIDYHLDVSKNSLTYDINRKLLATKNVYYTN